MNHQREIKGARAVETRVGWNSVRRRAALVLVLLGCARGAQAQAPMEAVEYYHLDALGSVRAVTDQSGAVVRTSDYRPFGEGENPAAGTDPTRFTGKERDAESGLDYFGARYYASRTGRFTTVDPLLPLDAALRDPQLWNRYAYVRNNPLRYTDPDGRCIWDLCIGEIAVATGVSQAAVGAAMAASAAAVFVWNKREEIAGSVVELGTAAGSALRQAVDSVKQASRADPYAYPGDYPQIDKTGKAHTRDQTLPDHVPESWNREMLEDAASTLRKSIKARQDEARRLGEDPGHRTRIKDEERLLRQVEEALKELQ
jgi:RHS repeat-associated protein